MASTLPTRFTKNREMERKTTEKVPQKKLDDFYYHAYICQDVLDSKWTDTNLINWLERDCGYKCSEYYRDILIGEKVLDGLCNFLFTSKKIIFILSESFVKSGLAMYQLHLAVQYCIDHDMNNIVVLHIDDCAVPKQLLNFECIKYNTKTCTWKDRLRTFLDKQTTSMPKEFCTSDTHVSCNDLGKTERSVMSDPGTLSTSRNALSIPENIRQKIKIWCKRRSIDKRGLLHDHSAHDKAERETEAEAQEQPEVTKEVNILSKQEAALAHALTIRSKGKQVFEATQNVLKGDDKELAMDEGDVIEMLDNQPERGHMYMCKNAQGKVGLVSKGFLCPSTCLLPSCIVKMARQEISPKDNNDFKDELVEFGHSYHLVIKDSIHNDFQNLSVRKNDILYKLTKEAAGMAKFKNCRNETGFVHMRMVVLVSSELISSPDRVSNISSGSEGYGSETGDASIA